MRSAVDRDDAVLIELLIAHGAERDDDALYHACEHGGTALLEALWKPGAEHYVGHKVDFEDVEGLRWFLDRGADVNERCCLHHAIARGRSLRFIQLILDAGADIDRPWTFWDVGRRPLALAARCGHLAAYELLESLGATAELDDVDRAVLAVARGESVALPRARPPALGNPETDDYGWIVGQFALLDRTEIVAARSSTPGGTSTPADGAASRRSTRRRCTAAVRRSSCWSSGAPTWRTGRGAATGRHPSTARSGASATTPLTTATTSARSRRSPRRARRRSTSRRAPTLRSTGCWSDTASGDRR